MSDTRVAEMLAIYAERLKLEFRLTELGMGHRGNRGTAREAPLRDFLQEHLPPAITAVGNSQLIDTSGNLSPQCDVVLKDAGTPDFFLRENIRTIPIEAVHGVFEVKSMLNGPHLARACENFDRIRSQPRTAFNLPGRGTVLGHGQPWEYEPVTCMVFAYDSVSLKRLGDVIVDQAMKIGWQAVPDAVWVFGKGFLLWTGTSGDFTIAPDEKCTLRVFQENPEIGGLLPLIMLLNTIMRIRWLAGSPQQPRVDWNAYISQVIIGYEEASKSFTRT